MMKKSTTALVLLYLLLPLLPGYLFFAAQTKITIPLLISKTAGIYAFVWYALQFVLTARLQAVERITSLDRRLSFHMKLAIVLIGIVFVHTLFGSEQYASRLQAGIGGTADTIFLWATLFSALFFTNYFIRYIPILIPYREKITAFFKLSHERYQLLHYAMPVSMTILIFHILLLPGEHLAAFKICMTVIAMAGLLIFGFQKFYMPRKALKSPWRVSEVIRESKTIITMTLSHPDSRRLFHYPGQFCYICPKDAAIPAGFHPFTISSPPDAPGLSFTIKDAGDFTHQLQQIRVHTQIGLIGPFGNFSYNRIPSGHALVLIAGGIGITPMLSMLRDISVKDSNRKVLLIWGVRHPSDLIRHQEIALLVNQMPNFIFEAIVSGPENWDTRKGRINGALLSELLSNYGFLKESRCPGTAFFLCGPAAMNADILKSLKKMGISAAHIHTERFFF